MGTVSQSQLLIDVFRAFEKREQRRKVTPKSNAMRMTFGKYIGQPLDQIPRGYLRWVVGNVPSLEPTLAEAIDKAIKGEAIPEDVVSNDCEELL
jgi:hypothetical protein